MRRHNPSPILQRVSWVSHQNDLIVGGGSEEGRGAFVKSREPGRAAVEGFGKGTWESVTASPVAATGLRKNESVQRST